VRQWFREWRAAEWPSGADLRRFAEEDNPRSFYYFEPVSRAYVTISTETEPEAIELVRHSMKIAISNIMRAAYSEAFR
jgi:hypothetical protein